MSRANIAAMGTPARTRKRIIIAREVLCIAQNVAAHVIVQSAIEAPTTFLALEYPSNLAIV